jgi:hypothetical protein
MILEKSKYHFGDDVWTIVECDYSHLKYLPIQSKDITKIMFLKGIKPLRTLFGKHPQYVIPEDIHPIIIKIFKMKYCRAYK